MHSVCHKNKTHYSSLAMLNLDLILMGLQWGCRHGKTDLTFIQANRYNKQRRKVGTSYLLTFIVLPGKRSLWLSNFLIFLGIG